MLNKFQNEQKYINIDLGSAKNYDFWQFTW